VSTYKSFVVESFVRVSWVTLAEGVSAERDGEADDRVNCDGARSTGAIKLVTEPEYPPSALPDAADDDSEEDSAVLSVMPLPAVT
jgi:hypothetical protein